MARVQPSVVSLGGGLILNKDVFSMSPGEALQLRNFEPDIEGGYKKLLGTTKYNTNVYYLRGFGHFFITPSKNKSCHFSSCTL